MPYIKRDKEGGIVAIYAEKQPDTTKSDQLDLDLIEFLLGPLGKKDKAGLKMLESDLRFIRVLEDLIDILIEKNVVLFTDFPKAAIEKLESRNMLRNRVRGVLSCLLPDSHEDPSLF